MQRQIDHARLLGTLPNGTKVYRVPVDVISCNSRELTEARTRVYVDAPNAQHALSFARTEFATCPETTLRAYGPKGGEYSRYVGWESAVWSAMLAEGAKRAQLALPL